MERDEGAEGERLFTTIPQTDTDTFLIRGVGGAVQDMTPVQVVAVIVHASKENLTLTPIQEQSDALIHQAVRYRVVYGVIDGEHRERSRLLLVR